MLYAELMIGCPVCASKVKISRLGCSGCGLALEGDFSLPRLARLPKEHQQMAEAFLLCGGNLKDLAVTLDVSYPTLRKRVDEMIAGLKDLKEKDKAAAETILADMEKGKIPAEVGIRKIKEMNGEL